MSELAATEEVRRAARDAFLATYQQDAKVEALPMDASFRRYFRLHKGDGASLLLMDAPPPHESIEPFLHTHSVIAQTGARLPQLAQHDRELGFLLLEDLGSQKLSSLLKQKGEQWPHYQHALDALVTLQSIAGEGMHLPAYDEAAIMRELLLFTEWYLPAFTGEFVELEQIEKFKQAWQGLMPLLTSGFPPVIVHRDYHVDNLMWLDAEETLAMIDFQDALIGSPAYDVVSLLKDARVEVSAEVEAKGIAYYLEKMQTSFPSSFDRKAFLAQYALWNVQRNLKILGIFARKAKRDNNPAYLVHLPRVIAHIHVGIKHPLLAPVREWLIKFAPGNFAK